MTQSSKPISLADSTLEAFAKKAGLPCKTGSVVATDNCFIVATPDNNKYFAYYRRNDTPIAYFTSPTLGRDLTREEARDLMNIIKKYVSQVDLPVCNESLARLEDNLPSLGFDTPTPLMTERVKPTPRPTQNAKYWTWSLTNE